MRLSILGAGMAISVISFFIDSQGVFFHVSSTLYLLLSGFVIARHGLLFSKLDSLCLSPLVLTALVSVLGTPLYLASSFTTLLTLVLLCMPGIGAVLTLAFTPCQTLTEKSSASNTPSQHIIAYAVFACLFIILFLVLLSSQTVRSVLGSWAVVHPIFFPLLLACVAFLIGLFLLPFASRFQVLSLSALVFLLFSVVQILFPLGYGFDPFIHQSAEKIIAQTGVLAPKTLYYTGHYILVVFLSLVTGLGTVSLDRFLLPVLCALSIPLLAWQACLRFTENRNALLLSLALAILLLPSLYSPTPWGLSILFLTAGILASILFLRDNRKFHGPFFVCLFALASVSIHPLAGIIACAFALLFTLDHLSFFYEKAGWFKIVFWIVFIVGCVSLPLAFALNASLSSQLSVLFSFPNFSFMGALDSLPWRFHALLDSAYGLHALLPLILLFIGVGVIATRDPKENVFARLTSLGLILSIANYLLLRWFVSFPSLISYERSAYADRLLDVSLIFAFILSAPFLSRCLTRLFAVGNPLIVKTVGAYLLAGIFTSAIYLSMPRNDAHSSFHGFNISADDIAAVRFIHTDAKNKPYIVLANQVVAGAALREYGFERYFSIERNGKKEDLFYYPIPTSSPLYGHYISMMEKTERPVIEKAMDLAGVNRAYFVIPWYEPRAPNIVKQAKRTADTCTSFNSGSLTVCLYVRSTHE